jgi:hypothetical protein
MPTVQGTNYLRLITTAVLLDSTYTLTCKDNNGNVFPKTTIEVNTTLGDAVINLPSIASLGAAAQNCEVVVVVDNDTNNIIIDPALTDSIGSAGAGVFYNLVAGQGNGQSVVLSPVDGTTWSVLYTA